MALHETLDPIVSFLEQARKQNYLNDNQKKDIMKIDYGVIIIDIWK